MDVIDMVDARLLKIACAENGSAALEAWVEPIRRGCRRFGIDTVREVAALLAQGGHESAGFTHLTENLNYSTAARIKAVFGQGTAGARRFPSISSCAPYVRNPERLANYVYANRMGNGPPESGDGWRFRGAGVFQLTGRDNQTAFGNAIAMLVSAVPAYLQTIEGAALSACWFFKVHGLEDLAATPGVTDETRAVNGGLNGLEDRKDRFDAVVAELLRRGA